MSNTDNTAALRKIAPNYYALGDYYISITRTTRRAYSCGLVKTSSYSTFTAQNSATGASLSGCGGIRVAAKVVAAQIEKDAPAEVVEVVETKEQTETRFSVIIARDWLKFAERTIARGEKPQKLSEQLARPYEFSNFAEEQDVPEISKAAQARITALSIARASAKLKAGEFPTVLAHFVARGIEDKKAAEWSEYKKSNGLDGERKPKAPTQKELIARDRMAHH